MKSAVLTLFLSVFMVAAYAGERDPALAGFFSAPLSISTSEGTRNLVVYLAVNDRQRARGLMHVRKLPPDYGMLFLYDHERPLSMWMKNTYIPLDMLFIRADGTIESIVENTEPHSLKSIPSSGNAMAVLELNAGSVKQFGIKPGDKVHYRAFKHKAP